MPPAVQHKEQGEHFACVEHETQNSPCKHDSELGECLPGCLELVCTRSLESFSHLGEALLT